MVQEEETLNDAEAVVRAGRYRAWQELAFYGHLEGGEGEAGEGRRTIANYLPSRRAVMMCQPMFLERERVTVKTSSLMALTGGWW